MYQARRIIILVVGFIVAFFLFMVLAFYIYPVINPDVKLGHNEGEVYLYDYAQFGPQAINELKKKVSSLELEVNEKRAKEMKDLALIDSLYQLNLSMEDELAAFRMGSAKTGLTTSLGKIDSKVAEVTKSLLRLEEDELALIVNRLDNSELVRIYNTSSNLQREKLLRSLEPNKVKQLLKSVMS
ncbi:hypothetical protein EP331_08455 [bacterium]|nr:MAG: hypothetical protein EP331_08455 [bacterium]